MTWLPSDATPTGRFEALAREASDDSSVIGLGGGLPAPEQFPRDALARAFAATLADPEGRSLQYDWPEGLASLRQFVAERLRQRGALVTPEEVIITSGAQQALAIAAQAIDHRSGTMAVDDETYPAALALFKAQEWELVPRRVGHRADATYVMPALANPRGTRMDAEQRARVLRQDCAIIEDDAYAELVFDGHLAPPLGAHDRSRVWHVGTLSKTLCPGLRVGWLVPPSQEARASLKRKRDLDLQTGGLAQALAARTLSLIDYDEHLARLRRLYLARAEAMATAIARWLPRWSFEFPAGGFAFWVEVDRHFDEAALLSAARAEGVSFDPGSDFRVWPGAPALRLCHSRHAPARLEEGIRRLARAFERHGAGS